jgi:hypothetical protein
VPKRLACKTNNKTFRLSDNLVKRTPFARVRRLD